MERFGVINRFIETRGFESYLEIGVNKHQCFDEVNAKVKESVDPDPEANPTYLMTSDEFWFGVEKQYDIIFIDGLHHGDQVYKDILGALIHLARPDSVIVLHDCNPANSVTGRHNLVEGDVKFKGDWNGDVWTGFTYFRLTSEYECYTVDVDQGCGVIDTLSLQWPSFKMRGLPSGIKKLYETLDYRDVCYLGYELLRDYRKDLLGLISEERFLEKTTI